VKTEKLNYELPSELIAQHPVGVRSESRLLVLDRGTGRIVDSRFERLGEFLRRGDCLVVNNTKVLPARFFARRQTGAKLEGLFLAEERPGLWQVVLKGLRKLKVGQTIYIRDNRRNDFCPAVLVEKGEAGKCLLELQSQAKAEAILEKIGFPPLPPYIKRNDDPALAQQDKLRYQTVYARVSGAVAAPTAGLHFTDGLIRRLQKAGIIFAYVTLHVGAGTFRPVTTENLETHRLDAERFSIDAENARRIEAAREAGSRVIAVGTTSTRTLESLPGPRIGPAEGKTDLFITPGYRFKFVDAMITNFHLPRSTLLALVAAFAGLDNVLAAYRHAVERRYRFYSYGDAMLIV